MPTPVQKSGAPAGSADEIAIRERPGLVARVLRGGKGPPVVAVMPLRLDRQCRDVHAQDLANTERGRWTAAAGRSEDPAAWRAELHPEDGRQPAFLDVRPIDTAGSAADDAVLARAALLASAPRLKDGRRFSLELQELSETHLLARVGGPGGMSTTLALRHDGDWGQISEMAEALAEAYDPDRPADAPLSPLARQELKGGVTAGLRDIYQASAQRNPWRLLHGYAILLQEWDRLGPEDQAGTYVFGAEPEASIALDRAGVADLGLTVGRRLIEWRQPDLAHYAAAAAADRAEAWRLPARAANLAQLCCIAAEGMMDAGELGRWSARALARLREGEAAPDAALSIFSTICVSRLEALAYRYPLSEEAWRATGEDHADEIRALGPLIDELRQARAAAADGSPRARFWSANDALLGIGHALQSGAFDEALARIAALDALPEATHPAIASILVHARLAHAFRCWRAGSGQRATVEAAWDAAERFWAALPEALAGVGQRRSGHLVLGAAVSLALDAAPEAAERAAAAYAAFAELQTGRIRPLDPAAPPGFVDMRFVAELVQESALRLAEREKLAVTDGADLAVLAAEISDREKSRDFSRALGFSATDVEAEFARTSASFRDGLSRSIANIVDPAQDPRPILANLETAAHYAGRGAERLVRRLFDAEHGPHLLRELPEHIAVLDLFAGEADTYLHLVRGGRIWPARLAVSRRALADAAARLRSAMNGNAMLPGIDGEAPWRRDALLAPAQQIVDGLHAILRPVLTGVDHLAISLHGAWFDLPVEAWLTECARRDDPSRVITASPGIGASHTMARRRKGGTATDLGLIVCPAAEDLAAAADDAEGLFGSARAELGEALRSLTDARRCRLFASRPGKADRDLLFDLMEGCGVLHVLAHGDDRSGADPIGSGLLLDIDGVPPEMTARRTVTAAEVMARPVRGRHVTLQACSLGRLRSAPDGELWGLARAFLSSGANTVIAPLWDVDIRSSTALFADMYRRLAVAPELPLRGAFAAAQAEMAALPAEHPWSHVYHWGAFRLIGDSLFDPPDQQGEANDRDA